MDINVQELFNAINRSDITAKDVDLIDNERLDSIDIMSLIEIIETKYNITLDASLIEAKNFQSFKSIEEIIRQSL